MSTQASVRIVAGLGTSVALAVGTPVVPAVAATGRVASEVMQCAGLVYASGVMQGAEAGGSTPQKALTAFGRGPARPLPLYGYEVLERSADMVLFAYRNNGGIKAAVRVEQNPKTFDDSILRQPWHFTSWAGCDPVEFAPSADDEIGIGLLSLENGTRLPARLAHQYPAPPHCFPEVSFLLLGRALPTYARDPQHVITEELVLSYDGATNLPTTAVDTGLRTGTFALFADTTDIRVIYAVGQERVERWPARLPRAGRPCG